MLQAKMGTEKLGLHFYWCMENIPRVNSASTILIVVKLISVTLLRLSKTQKTWHISLKMKAFSLRISINETGFLCKAVITEECHQNGPGSI